LAEKPAIPESNWAVPGLYIFDASACEKAESIKPSHRGELEIIDILNDYLTSGNLVTNKISRGNTWLDLGTAENLLLASQYVHLLQSRQGMLVGSPEEATLNVGNISNKSLEKFIKSKPKSEYFLQLEGILKN
jgi:glucose-1-phosphate thymidylyltransferase